MSTVTEDNSGLSQRPSPSSAAELIAQLRAKGVNLWVEGDKLRYSAAKNVMTAELLAEVSRHRSELLNLLRAAGAAALRIPRAPRDKPLPLSFAQQRLWFLDQLSPDNAFYNIPAVVPVDTFIDPRVLERAINEIVRRHESLRTTFPMVDGQPVQMVHPAASVALEVIDLTHLAEAEREAEARRLAAALAQRGFQLAIGPLLRTALLKLNDRKWIFLLTVHHIVSDGWSIEVLWRELAAIYAAFAIGRPSPLPELPIQYADFAVWQRDWLSGAELERQLGYWRRRLVDLPTLSLPTDRPRPPMPSFRGETVPVALGATLSAQVRELGRRTKCTPFMVLLAAFAALLSRYASESDVAIGTYVANRGRSELEGLIGFFVNTLVMRVDLSGDPTFEQVLARVRDTALGTYAHQDLPFSKLVEEVHPERDLSRNPLFQVVFHLGTPHGSARFSDSRDQSPDRSSNLAGDEQRPAIFDLVLDLVDASSGFHGWLAYSADLFDQDTMRRMAEHLVILIQGAIRDPRRHLSDLPLLSAAERGTLLVDWNATLRSVPDQPGLSASFDDMAARFPDAPAFFCNGEQLTYAQLRRKVDRLASALRQHDVGPGSLVAICVHRSFAAIVALMAVMKAGGAYVPLDPAYPRDRLAFMLDDAAVEIAITAGAAADTLEAIIRNSGRKLRTIDIDDLDDSAGTGALPHALAHPAPQPAPDQLAYVIYTSGSTGLPKGVAVEHRQILNRLRWMWDAYPFRPGDVGAQKTALSFVDSIWEVFGPLLQGVPSVIIPDDDLKDLDALVATLAEFRVTHLWFVPSMLRAMLDRHPDLGSRLPHLRFWVSSGEPLVADLFEQFRRCVPQGTLYNLYGISEVWDATWYDPNEAGAEEPGRVMASIPIGRPIANVRVYVLDPRLRLVPIGVYGELCIGGDGLARGYLNRPEMTAERFIAIPPDIAAGEGSGLDRPGRERENADGPRLYRTGDIVRWCSNGQLEFLGRADRQIKIRGFRIEPAEVETVLRSHPSVQDAAVLARPSQSGEGTQAELRLIAYVAGAPAQPDPVALRIFLQDRLPDYMVPSTFIVLESLPLTPSGKIDRKSLPEPNATGLAEIHKNPVVPPKTATEIALAELWAAVLDGNSPSPVSATDNFFRDLGGHSLLATRVMTKVRERFGVSLPLRLLFERPTVASLAGAIDEALARSSVETPDASRSIPPLVRLSREQARVTISPRREQPALDARAADTVVPTARP